MVLPFRRAVAQIDDLVDHPPLDLFVHLDHRFGDLHRHGVILPDPGQGLGILGETRPAIARPRMQELVADPPVQPHALGHVLDIGADPFAQGRDFVDEGDLGGQKGVGRVFDHLGAFQPGEDHRKFAQEQRAVDIAPSPCAHAAFPPPPPPGPGA